MIGYVIRGEVEAEEWYHGHMTMKEAAAYLSVSTSTLRKLVKEHKIPYSRHSYRNSSAFFHETILDAWMKSEFPPGRIELILDDQSIEWDHRDALREHYHRYPELKAKPVSVTETVVNIESVSNDKSEFDVSNDGVRIKVQNGNIMLQAFLTHEAVDDLVAFVPRFGITSTM